MKVDDKLSFEKSSNKEEISETSSISHADKTVTIYNADDESFEQITKDWTPEEERKATRKLDFFLMPLLFFAFFILQVDRGNISSALTSTLREDIGLDNDKINAGTALFNVGIVIFEIPSNMIMQKIGPAKWLSFQIVAWSLCATLQATIFNYPTFLVARLFMGIMESGFIPGGLYYISTWYTRRQVSSRYTLYFLGNMSASAAGSLIAAGILKHVAGNFGLAGWKWIFIIEGVMGIGYGLIFALLIPDSPTNPTPFWGGFRFLNERESKIIRGKVLLDDPEKISSSSHILSKDLKDTFMQWRIWLHFLFTMVFMQSVQTLGTYIPSIVQSLGYSSVSANAMSSVGSWCSVGMILILTLITRYTKIHAISITFISLWQMVFSIVLYQYAESQNKNLKYAILVCLQISGAIGHVLNCAWASANIKKPAHRSIAMAMLVMAANLAGICAGQILRTNDLPYYTRGFLALMILGILTVCVSVVIFVQYFFSNRILERKKPSPNRSDLEHPETGFDNNIIVVGKQADKSKSEEECKNTGIQTGQEIEGDAVASNELFRYSI